MSKWTPEQLSIFAAVETTNDNLMIEALAGSGKTTTLVEVARRLGPGTLVLAFNKKIADELSHRLPREAEARTLNSLGHRILAQKLGKRLNLSSSKLRYIITDLIKEAPSSEQDDLWEDFPAILSTCQWAKAHGHIPDSHAEKLPLHTPPFLSNTSLLAECPEELSSSSAAIVLTALTKSFSEALGGKIDFADQLLLPAFMKCLYPVFHNVLVDEAQDLSSLNHLMLARLSRRRFIAVGDSLQAIYAFRGARTDSMSALADHFSTTTYHLSTSFRCPEAVCYHVRGHAPRIQAWLGNPANPGSVTTLPIWRISDVPDGSAILCRNNAPLFFIAIQLIRAGRRPNVWGRDLARGLLTTMEKLGAPNMSQADAFIALEAYVEREEAKLKKASAKRILADRAACIHTFISASDTLGSAITLANNVFTSEGKIDLATGHKAKGAEWDNVFILDRHLLSDEEQDLNLSYVLATRAKQALAYIESDGLVLDS